MMGELNYFLGIKQLKEDIFINQVNYIKDLIKKFGMKYAMPVSTPMSTSTKLDSDEKGKLVDIKLYRIMISSLLYFTTSKLDIMFSVYLCARF